MFGIGTFELLIILFVSLVILGPKRVPELAGKLGKGLVKFRKEMEGFKKSMDMTSSSDDKGDDEDKRD